MGQESSLIKNNAVEISSKHSHIILTIKLNSNMNSKIKSKKLKRNLITQCYRIRTLTQNDFQQL